MKNETWFLFTSTEIDDGEKTHTKIRVYGFGSENDATSGQRVYLDAEEALSDTAANVFCRSAVVEWTVKEVDEFFENWKNKKRPCLDHMDELISLSRSQSELRELILLDDQRGIQLRNARLDQEIRILRDHCTHSDCKCGNPVCCFCEKHKIDPKFQAFIDTLAPLNEKSCFPKGKENN